ncbi:hypothetical protein HK102_002500 [Quaeritorhiza haematococci]|nr:hypothetical protein HK102_002500 [Quaeritorhiza haematococci]
MSAEFSTFVSMETGSGVLFGGIDGPDTFFPSTEVMGYSSTDGIGAFAGISAESFRSDEVQSNGVHFGQQQQHGSQQPYLDKNSNTMKGEKLSSSDMEELSFLTFQAPTSNGTAPTSSLLRRKIMSAPDIKKLQYGEKRSRNMSSTPTVGANEQQGGGPTTSRRHSKKAGGAGGGAARRRRTSSANHTSSSLTSIHETYATNPPQQQPNRFQHPSMTPTSATFSFVPSLEQQRRGGAATAPPSANPWQPASNGNLNSLDISRSHGFGAANTLLSELNREDIGNGDNYMEMDFIDLENLTDNSVMDGSESSAGAGTGSGGKQLGNNMTLGMGPSPSSMLTIPSAASTSAVSPHSTIPGPFVLNSFNTLNPDPMLTHSNRLPPTSLNMMMEPLLQVVNPEWISQPPQNITAGMNGFGPLTGGNPLVFPLTTTNSSSSIGSSDREHNTSTPASLQSQQARSVSPASVSTGKGSNSSTPRSSVGTRTGGRPRTRSTPIRINTQTPQVQQQQQQQHQQQPQQHSALGLAGVPPLSAYPISPAATPAITAADMAAASAKYIYATTLLTGGVMGTGMPSSQSTSSPASAMMTPALISPLSTVSSGSMPNISPLIRTPAVVPKLSLATFAANAAAAGGAPTPTTAISNSFTAMNLLSSPATASSAHSLSAATTPGALGSTGRLVPSAPPSSLTNLAREERSFVQIGDLIKANDVLKQQIAEAKAARQREEAESMQMIETLNRLMGMHRIENVTTGQC